MDDSIDIVFDGPPSHESGRFVEVEDSGGYSMRFGEWVERDDGFWALRIPRMVGWSSYLADIAAEQIERLEAENKQLRSNARLFLKELNRWSDRQMIYPPVEDWPLLLDGQETEPET